MESLNQKISAGNQEQKEYAQQSGIYGFNSSITPGLFQRLESDSNGALSVNLHGAEGSGDLKARTDVADPTTSTFLKCDADGKLEIEATLELDSSTLAKEVTLVALNDKVTTCDTGAIAGTVAVSGVAGTVAVTASALPLPSGASTSLLQGSQLTQETFTALRTAEISISTASLDSKITSGADTTLATAQQVLIYGEVTSGPGTGELHPIHITSAGDVEVEIADFVKGQDTMSASFPVVIASDQSSLTVDGTVAVSGVTGTVAVSAVSLPLPGGASTETTLSALNTKVTACDTGAIAGTVAVSGVAGTVAVSAISLPLPGGASTETTLSALNTKITKGNDATLVEAQQVGSYAMNESTGLFQPLSAHHSNKSLKTTDANITKGSDMTLTEAQQVFAYGCDFAGDLRPLKVGTTGRLIVEVDGIRVNDSQIGWTIANGATATSTEILMNTHTRIAFYGDTNNTFNANFHIEYSQDGVSWFRGSDDNSKVIIVSATGNFYDEEIITPPRVRLTRTNNSGASESVNLYWTQL